MYMLRGRARVEGAGWRGWRSWFLLFETLSLVLFTFFGITIISITPNQVQPPLCPALLMRLPPPRFLSSCGRRADAAACSLWQAPSCGPYK